MADTPVKIYHVEDTEANLIANLSPLQWGLATDTEKMILQHGFDSGYTSISTPDLTDILMTDNTASAFRVRDSLNDYIKINTTTTNKRMYFGFAAMKAHQFDSEYFSVFSSQDVYIQGLVSLSLWSNAYMAMEVQTGDVQITAGRSGSGVLHLDAYDEVDILSALISITGNTVQIYTNDDGGAKTGAFEVHSRFSAADKLITADTDATSHWTNLKLFSDIPEGFTPEFTVSGYKSGDALRTLSINIDSVTNDTVNIEGLTNYNFIGENWLYKSNTAPNNTLVTAFTSGADVDIYLDGTGVLTLDARGGNLVLLSTTEIVIGDFTNDPDCFVYSTGIFGLKNGGVWGQTYQHEWIGDDIVIGLTTSGSITFVSEDIILDPSSNIIVADGVINYTGSMGNSTKDPTTDAPTDWLQIKISGTDYYVPAYTAS